jgi:hypothetical protein
MTYLDDSITALLERHYLKLAHGFGWHIAIRRIDVTELKNGIYRDDDGGMEIVMDVDTYAAIKTIAIRVIGIIVFTIIALVLYHVFGG